MINLGVIGTNWITRVFINAALATGEYELTAVYSRKLETAQKFVEDFSDVEIATDLKTFFELEHLDTVYIASPNSLHFEQARAAILAGKNVIVEKPAFSTPDEMAEIIQLANQKRVFFFEAARNIHEAGFKKIVDYLCDKQVIGASFTYMKYSSRYDAVLDGEEPNIFSPHFSGGAIMDLGVYLVYAALGWFGMPRSQYYFAQKISTGVDGLGLGVLRYEDFDVALQTGKIGDSFLPSEIYFEDGTLILSGVSAFEKAEFYHRTTKKTTVLFDQGEKLPMFDQATDFAKVIQNPSDPDLGEAYQEWVELARNVNEVIYALRKQANITFDADK
ncbi:Gfo/Idh/MocA family protein [Enterococcus sp. HY326]|uniref:Gfo/Idh/MocA family protein n=1 Tax=Enterococcus sp. HY326 TaxID=2971265 RepID=UPI0022409958|nr:Gfo/Idh/MocA family oxidoreductase [Enterococcus sp. HY326]